MLSSFRATSHGPSNWIFSVSLSDAKPNKEEIETGTGDKTRRCPNINSSKDKLFPKIFWLRWRKKGQAKATARIHKQFISISRIVDIENRIFGSCQKPARAFLSLNPSQRWTQISRRNRKRFRSDACHTQVSITCEQILIFSDLMLRTKSYLW